MNYKISEDKKTLTITVDIAERMMLKRMDEDEFKTFTTAYIVAAMWSTNDDSGEPLDKGYYITDLATETVKTIDEDCAKFLEENYELVKDDISRAGHDFWLTRKKHGAGFWDGDWPEPAGTILTEASKKCKELDLYVGEDNKLYFQ